MRSLINRVGAPLPWGPSLFGFGVWRRPMLTLSVGLQVKRGEFQRVDVMHYHISPNGHYDGAWSDAQESYRGIMRDPDMINFITVLREPRSHFLRCEMIEGFYVVLVPRSPCMSSCGCSPRCIFVLFLSVYTAELLESRGQPSHMVNVKKYHSVCRTVTELQYIYRGENGGRKGGRGGG